MAVKKIAISIPEDVLRQVDRLAKRTRTTRSGCITQVLARVAHASNQAEITDRINALFVSDEASGEQAKTASDFLRAAEKGIGDSEW